MNTFKKITRIQKNKNCLALLLIFFFFISNLLHAQVQNNGSIYISDGAFLYLKSGNYNFGAGSSTKTSTTPSSHGKLFFDASATHSDAESGATRFVQGCVSTKCSTYFILPTGQTTTYAPIGITNAVVTDGVTATYANLDLSTAAKAFSITTLPSNMGVWKVSGDDAKLTLIWSSDISALTNSITDLTVAGFNTSTNKWEAISSAIPTGSLSSGTIQTSSAVVFGSTYSEYTLADKGTICAPVFAATGTTKTWNGSWSPSAPTDIDNAVIAVVGAPGSFVCNSLDVQANISLTDGQTIEVVNAITGSGVISLSSQASILQRNDASVISPTISLTKSTRNGMYALDYIYWGTPLKQTENTLSLLATAQAYVTSNASTSGAVGALSNFYKYVAGDISASGGWQTLSSNPVVGTRFITRIKNQVPFATLQVQNNTDHINLTFEGASNNGTITVPIANNIANPGSSRNFNLFGNPYPSAIDADKFLEYNTDLDGAVYIWKATTPSSVTGGSSYTSADYIAYTKAGTTAESGFSTTVFNGKIASGQGFRVKSITPSGSGTATFNNCMRVSGNNDQFMRTNNTVTIDRFKLNFNGFNGVGNQILVAYIPETTLGYDRMYDAELSSVSPARLYSLLDNTTIQLGINARPTFATTDVVNLGIDKSNTSSENFTIAIADKEGIFQSNEIDVLLHDKQVNIFHNLANGPYQFTSNTTQSTNRFEVVYQQAALGNPDFITNTAFASINNQTLKVSANMPMTTITVYDLTGRLVTNLTIDNQLQVNNFFNHALGIYIVKIKTNDGESITQKLINN